MEEVYHQQVEMYIIMHPQPFQHLLEVGIRIMDGIQQHLEDQSMEMREHRIK